MMVGSWRLILGHEGVRKLGQLGIEIEGNSGIFGIDAEQPVKSGKTSASKVSLFMVI